LNAVKKWASHLDEMTGRQEIKEQLSQLKVPEVVFEEDWREIWPVYPLIREILRFSFGKIAQKCSRLNDLS
jgi:hypothetical protein